MDGYDLRIDNLEETDSGKRFYLKNQLNFKSNCTIFFSLLGTYVCEIETHGSPLHQTSQLEILGKSCSIYEFGTKHCFPCKFII